MHTHSISSEGQNLLKPNDPKEKANHAALSFLHVAQLFELFPSKDTLQNTPMLVETLASVSSLTRESAAEGIDQQLLFCVRCAASWLFCDIVQWESKVSSSTLFCYSSSSSNIRFLYVKSRMSVGCCKHFAVLGHTSACHFAIQNHQASRFNLACCGFEETFHFSWGKNSRCHEEISARLYRCNQ